MMNRSVASRSLRVLVVVGVASVTAGVGCATATPQSVEADQRAERASFREGQREDDAAFARKQQDQRSALVADQAKERVDVAASNLAERKNFAIGARERVARLDARLIELRSLGKSIDPMIFEARDAVLAHINDSDAATMTHQVWMQDRDTVNSELTALNTQIERASK